MAAVSERIYRREALDRLSSPERLDRLITLTSPIGWATLSAIAALLAAVVAWGIFGSIPTRVQGVGILVTRGGQIFDAMASGSGTLASVAAMGATVEKGDVVATLDDTQADQELQHARHVLAEQERDLAQLVERFDHEIAARLKVDVQQRDNLAIIIASAEQRRTFYQKALKGDQEVEAKGFVTPRFVQETRQNMDAAEQDGRRARNDLLRIDAEELDLQGRRDQEIYHQQEAVNSARRAVEELTIRNGQKTKVISPVAGHVTEVKATPGTVVAAGKPVLSIETGGHGLELVLYIPPEQGKKIAPGMEARIEPATARKEEFGTMLGSVVNVSEFPVSSEGMLAILQNHQLAARFSSQGAPYETRVELIADAHTPSGYAWAGGQGPPITLTSGTTASAEVTVRTQAPITLVLPLLRERIGMSG
jgi:HlyD family secretion protein